VAVRRNAYGSDQTDAELATDRASQGHADTVRVPPRDVDRVCTAVEVEERQRVGPLLLWREPRLVAAPVDEAERPLPDARVDPTDGHRASGMIRVHERQLVAAPAHAHQAPADLRHEPELERRTADPPAVPAVHEPGLEGHRHAVIS